MGQSLFVNPAAVIPDSCYHPFSVAGCHDLDPGIGDLPLHQNIPGIVQDVHQHLGKLVGVATDAQIFTVVLEKLSTDAAGGKCRCRQGQGFGDGRYQGKIPRDAAIPHKEAPEVVYGV